MPSDKTLDVRPGSLDATSMRYHELWLQRWLYSRFYVREGYPIPVVFSTPMDAFSHFNKLWADEQNPFKYLLEVKDEFGTPVYEPHPSPVRYPLISVMRKGIKFRPYQNFSIHQWRHINWPTVSDAQAETPGKEQIGTDLTKCNLGNVTTSRMPMAFDYRFQIDHFCLRPDTQAFFVERLLNQFWRGGGGMQSWMDIEYPGWGTQYIRIYLDGDIDQSVPEEYQDKHVEFRTSFTLVIEGFSIDLNYQVKPALWKFIPWSGTPDELTDLLRVKLEVDLRQTGYNPVLESRTDIPSAGTCQSDLLYATWNSSGTAHVYLGDQPGTNAPDNVVDSNHIPVLLPTDAIIVAATTEASGSQAPYPGPPSLFYGIPSTLVFGYGTLVGPTIVSAGTFTESAASSAGFFAGTMDLASFAVDAGTYYESGTSGVRFQVGSMDLFAYTDAPVSGVGFSGGTHTEVTAAAGTFVALGTSSVGLYAGSHASAIVHAGTFIELGTSAVGIGTGTYLEVVVNAGTYTSMGTSTVGFSAGTHIQLVYPAGTFYASGSSSVGFYGGSHDPA